MMRGNLYVVSGPSGVGKSTICKLVREKLKINLSISATTRKKRVSEVDGKDYYFFTKTEFKNKIKNDEFLEHAIVHNNYYGTLKSEIETELSNGKDVILEIDVQGGMQIKEKVREANLIFISPPSIEELEKRLRSRDTDDEDSISVRLSNSISELEYKEKYDRVFVNEELEETVDSLINFLRYKTRGKMKKNISFDDVIGKIPNKYILTTIAGKRANELRSGESSLIPQIKRDSLTNKALKEIYCDRIKVSDYINQEDE